MSDNTADPSFGEPVDDTVNVDDVVGAANEGLADAVAVGDAVGDANAESAPQDATDARVVADVEMSAVDAAADPEPAAAAPVEPAPTEPAIDEEPDWSLLDDIEIEPVADVPPVAETVVAAPAVVAEPTAVAPVVAPVVDQPTVVMPPVITPSEPATVLVPPVAETVPSVLQPVYVQAPEPPLARGNRGTAGLIGLLATVAFGVLFMVGTLLVGITRGTVGWDSFLTGAGVVATTWGYWTTVVVFFLAFWLLGVFVNRASWGKWVIFSLFVGFATWAGYVLGQLIDAQFWTRSLAEVGEIAAAATWAPLAIIAFIIARELPIWFGAWVARIGRRKTELNDQDYREYEELIAAGPKVHSA